MLQPATTRNAFSRHGGSALLSLLLGLGLIVGSASILPRTLSEQEHETPTHVLCTAKSEASGSGPEMPRGAIAQRQARQRAVSGLQSRHTNSEPSRRNGKGCHLLL